jgi:hypothetical protein
LWCLILALDSNWKDLNHWFKVAIMAWKSCCRKAGWVDNFKAVLRPLWCQLAKKDHTRV